MSRKLASIRRIKEIIPHTNADALELALIDGWQVVVKKDEFKPSDHCVYFEIDSFLPREERYQFLARNSFRSTPNLGDGYKLRTVKLRGELSQGLALPVNMFPELENVKLIADLDVTDVLKVQKFELPEATMLAGRIKGNFPSFLRKTDQERVQNLIGKISNYYQDEYFEVTVKLDGSSMTVYSKDAGFGVCSRNLDLTEDDTNAFWKMARQYDLVERLPALGMNIAIQGELVGPGIQGNPQKLDKLDFYVFDIYDIDRSEYMLHWERKLITSVLGLNHVPVISEGMSFSHLAREELKEYILGLAEGTCIITDCPREGIVFKCLNKNFSFKAIANSYLLNEKS